MSPLIGTHAGGSAAGFGTLHPGIRISDYNPGVTAVSGGTEMYFDGIPFWYGNHSTSVWNYYNNNNLILTTVPGEQFYLALVGASGCGSADKDRPSGGGGFGIAKITVPAGVTTMTVMMGGGGRTSTSDWSGTLQSSEFGGGPAGGGNGTRKKGACGGGISMLVSGNAPTPTHSNVICCVGSGGGGGSYTDSTGGNGGGFNQNGGNASGGHVYELWFFNPRPVGNNWGSGATTSSGGAKATRNDGYYSNIRTYPNNGNGSAGSALLGGTGDGGEYEGGAGGGGGWYGGGGGAAGGGYDCGGGGGGSGKTNAGAQSMYTSSGTHSGTPMTTLQTYIRSYSTSTAFVVPNTLYGKSVSSSFDRGYPGWACVFNLW
jgi:hypothetical protein